MGRKTGQHAQPEGFIMRQAFTPPWYCWDRPSCMGHIREQDSPTPTIQELSE